MTGVITDREYKKRSEKPPRVSGDKRIEPTAEQAIKFEADYADCLNDPDLLLIAVGTVLEREQYIQTVRTWAVDRQSGRVTLRIYPHPNPRPRATYYRLMPFVRNGDNGKAHQ